MAASLQLLYPNDPFQPKEPDEMYAEEYHAAKEAGLAVARYSHEDLLSGQAALKSALLPEVPVLLRGWMLPVELYATLVQQIGNKGAPVLISAAQYRMCHHLPGWYSQLRAYTPDTVFADEGDNYAEALAHKSWAGFFVKDHVKSLSTGQGSLCTSVDKIAGIVEDIRKFRGHIEGGVAIREVEEFQPGTEERYFVFKGTPYARDGQQVPSVVARAAQTIDSPFFSVDTVLRKDGQMRIVELGDGQVSDRKAWSVGEFLGIFQANAQKESAMD